MDSSRIISSSSGHGRPLVVAVEGNIGSGKTTFLSFCEQYEDMEVLYEPVNEWKSVGGVNLLDLFYGNPSRYAMSFQMQVNLSLLSLYRKTAIRPIRLVERSLLSTRNCFQRILLSNGTLEPVMGTVLDNWHSIIGSSWDALPNAIVYLRTTPTMAHNRMRLRARVEEADVGLDYLRDLHDLHEDWLGLLQQENLNGESDTPIFTIDADLPLGTLSPIYDSCVRDLHLLRL